MRRLVIDPRLLGPMLVAAALWIGSWTTAARALIVATAVLTVVRLVTCGAFDRWIDRWSHRARHRSGDGPHHGGVRRGVRSPCGRYGGSPAAWSPAPVGRRRRVTAPTRDACSRPGVLEVGGRQHRFLSLIGVGVVLATVNYGVGFVWIGVGPRRWSPIPVVRCSRGGSTCRGGRRRTIRGRRTRRWVGSVGRRTTSTS